MGISFAGDDRRAGREFGIGAPLPTRHQAVNLFQTADSSARAQGRAN